MRALVNADSHIWEEENGDDATPDREKSASSTGSDAAAAATTSRRNTIVSSRCFPQRVVAQHVRRTRRRVVVTRSRFGRERRGIYLFFIWFLLNVKSTSYHILCFCVTYNNITLFTTHRPYTIVHVDGDVDCPRGGKFHENVALRTHRTMRLYLGSSSRFQPWIMIEFKVSFIESSDKQIRKIIFFTFDL